MQKLKIEFEALRIEQTATAPRKMLKALYEELSFPSKTKLAQAARKRGLKPTQAELDAVVKAQPVSQLFSGKAPAQRGAIATSGPQDKWQADLFDLKQYNSKKNGQNAALVVTNVFDRKRTVVFTR